MSIDVYEQIPVMESEKFLLREIEDEDAGVLFAALLGVVKMMLKKF